MLPQKDHKEEQGGDRTDMKEETRVLRCTLLNGSAWSTERKYIRRYKGKCDIFLGIEHRLKKEEMEEQFNEEAKEGWICAAEGRKHTSRGVSVAVDSNPGAVVGAEKGTIVSISGNEGRIAQTWVNVTGGLRVFSVYIWHSKKAGLLGMKPRWKQF